VNLTSEKKKGPMDDNSCKASARLGILGNNVLVSYWSKYHTKIQDYTLKLYEGRQTAQCKLTIRYDTVRYDTVSYWMGTCRTLNL